jgi:hypothetical protein
VSEEIPADFQRDFAALWADETPIPLVLKPLQLWGLMCAVQLASKHPSARQTQPIAIAVEVARAIQDAIATTPALARIAEQGWEELEPLH